MSQLDDAMIQQFGVTEVGGRDLRPVHTGTMWLIVNQVSGSSLPCIFTASHRRQGAWQKFESLYEKSPVEIARVRRERKSGVLRAVRAVIAWRLP